MTPDERQLIDDLFDRMSRFGAPEKDRDAATLIDRNVRAMPDAPYMLVQSVLVQEHALQQADERIRDLEAQVRDLERGQAQPSSGGSFLGGLFGGSRPAPNQEPRPSTSVPAMGSRPGEPLQPAPGWQARGPANDPGPPQQAPAGGGFLRSAMTTAAGVAGGMLLADSIRGMMGGGHGNPFGTSTAEAKEHGSGSDHMPQIGPADDNDPGNTDMTQHAAAQDSDFPDDNDPGWGDDEIEI